MEANIKVYIFKDKNGLYNALAENGDLLAVDYFTSLKYAKEYFPTRKQLKEHDCEFVVSKEWEHEGIISAKQLYLNNYGASFDGRC